MPTDTNKLYAYIAERRKAIRKALEDERDRGLSERLNGGMTLLKGFEARLDRGDFKVPEERTAIDKISVPAKLKVRAKAPDTSWEAAASIAPEKSRRLYDRIKLHLLEDGPSTDDELRHAMKWFLEEYKFSPEGVTNRRGELVKAGWVRKTGLRRKGDSGASMTVWEWVL